MRFNVAEFNRGSLNFDLLKSISVPGTKIEALTSVSYAKV